MATETSRLWRSICVGCSSTLNCSKATGPTALAWLAHEAENYEPNGDDITQMHIDSVLSGRPTIEYQKFRDEYMRLWPKHAAHHGYDKQANDPS